MWFLSRCQDAAVSLVSRPPGMSASVLSGSLPFSAIVSLPALMLAALRKRRAVHRVGFWWHSIDLGDGVTTPGFKSPETLAGELDAIGLPTDLTGRSVLDVGGWDGWFAFEAERRGAGRVAVL